MYIKQPPYLSRTASASLLNANHSLLSPFSFCVRFHPFRRLLGTRVVDPLSTSASCLLSQFSPPLLHISPPYHLSSLSDTLFMQQLSKLQYDLPSAQRSFT